MRSRMLAFSVLGRGNVLSFFERADEKARGAVSDRGCDLADRHLGLDQQSFCLANPKIGQVVDEVVPRLFLEDRREISG